MTDIIIIGNTNIWCISLARKEGIVSYFKELSVIGYDSFHGPNF